MNLADLERISGDLDALRGTWEAAILTTVADRLDDALAHAVKAASESTARAQHGQRVTVTRSGMKVAVKRLDDLWVDLTGPSEDSLNGAIRDARAELYELAFTRHKAIFPPEYLVSADAVPTTLNTDLVRAAMVHGYDPHTELARPIQDAQRRLAIATNAATHNPGMLKVWHKQTMNALSQTVRTLLNDSAEYADGEARRDLTAPEFRSDYPLTSKGF